MTVHDPPLDDFNLPQAGMKARALRSTAWHGEGEAGNEGWGSSDGELKGAAHTETAPTTVDRLASLPPSSLRLPPELLDYILSFLHLGDGNVDRPTLASCCLASRALLSFAQRRLFSDLDITLLEGPQGDIMSAFDRDLFALLRRRPDLAAHVELLTWDNSGTWGDGRAAMEDYLERHSELEDGRPTAELVDELLDRHTCDPEDELVSLVAHLPNLRRLTAVGSSVATCEALAGRTPALEAIWAADPFSPSSLDFPSLRHISFFSFYAVPLPSPPPPASAFITLDMDHAEDGPGDSAYFQWLISASHTTLTTIASPFIPSYFDHVLTLQSLATLTLDMPDDGFSNPNPSRRLTVPWPPSLRDLTLRVGSVDGFLPALPATLVRLALDRPLYRPAELLNLLSDPARLPGLRRLIVRERSGFDKWDDPSLLWAEGQWEQDLAPLCKGREIWLERKLPDAVYVLRVYPDGTSGVVLAK